MRRLIGNILEVCVFYLVNVHEYLSYIGRSPDSDKEMARVRREYNRVVAKEYKD